MSWSILAGLPNPIIVDAAGTAGSGYVLKAYLPGTTTSTSLAIDSSGTSPQTSITANTNGVWEVSGNEVTPYIDRKCKWGIFLNAADAAANTPFYMGPFNNVPVKINPISFSTVADLRLGNDSEGGSHDFSQMVGSRVEWMGYHAESDGGSNWGIIRSGAHTDDGGSVFSFDANTYIEANHGGKKINARKFGANHAQADNLAYIDAAVAYMPEGSVLYFPAGGSAGEYDISAPIVISKRIDIKGDTYWGSVIRNNNVAGANAIVFDTSWYQSISDMSILGNASSGSGISIESSNFKLLKCRVDGHGVHGVYIQPQNWTIQISRCLIRSNGTDGINAIATGPTGQINAINIDQNTVAFNGRDGIRCGGTSINITNGTNEVNIGRGITFTCEGFSCYNVNVQGVHFEVNPGGHIVYDCYPSLGFTVLKSTVTENYFLLDAADADAGTAMIRAITDTQFEGIRGLNIDNSNMILTDSVPHVDLNDAVNIQAQSKIETVMTGDTSDFSLFYKNIGHGAIRPYQKTKILSGYFSGKGTLAFSSIIRSANVNAGILAGPINAEYPAGFKSGDYIKKIGVRISTDNTNYSVIFNVWKRVSTSTVAYSLATTYTLSGLSGSGSRNSPDFVTLTNPTNTRVQANEEYYIELIYQSAAGGGTYFYAYNPIITYCE